MGIFHRTPANDQDERKREAEAGEPVCPHTALISHWDNPGDMGKPEKATYKCEACGETFTYEQARQFLNQPPAAVTAARE